MRKDKNKNGCGRLWVATRGGMSAQNAVHISTDIY